MFLYFTTFTSHSFHILFLTDQIKGFVSIFQLLGRYVRRISVVLLLQSCKVSECKLVTIKVDFQSVLRTLESLFWFLVLLHVKYHKM